MFQGVVGPINNQRYEEIFSQNARDRVVAKSRRALGCMELTPDTQASLRLFLDYINDQMNCENYMGFSRFDRANTPEELEPRFHLLFHPKAKLSTFSWMWEHMSSTYIIDEFILVQATGYDDVLVRVTTDDWVVSFSTSKFLHSWRRYNDEPDVTVYSGWVDSEFRNKTRRVNHAIDFKIHNGEEAFYRDLIMLKLSL